MFDDRVISITTRVDVSVVATSSGDRIVAFAPVECIGSPQAKDLVISSGLRLRDQERTHGFHVPAGSIGKRNNINTGKEIMIRRANQPH